MKNIRDYFPDSFMNANAADCPPFSVLPIVTPGGQLSGKDVLIKADKASSTAGVLCIVNGPVTVKAGKPGKCNASGGLVLFAYDTGTPALGDKYGPKSGQWTATKDGSPACITAIYIVDSTNKIALGYLNAGGSSPSQVISSDTHSAVTTATTSFSISSCSIVEPGIGDSASGSVTVYNVFGWAIDANGLVWAKWNQATSHYELFQAKCPA